VTDDRREDHSRGGADRALVTALQDPRCFDHPVERFELFETHISWVLLTGPFAYKIKKPVKLPFLDFTTLRDRKHYCEEEVRINRRLAPEIYVDVVPITGSRETPSLAESGKPIEYAVKMVQFPADERMDLVAARGELTEEHVRRLAAKIAAFHLDCAVAEPGSPYADSEHLRRELMDNFDALRECGPGADLEKTLRELRRFAAQSLVDLGAEFRSRKRRGLVRECHGDMHLANMALHEGDVVVFDAIEFSDDLRWIDVMSDVAFLVMDLDYRGLTPLGRLFLNRYLEGSGDYAGLAVLRHYRVYRAMVRSKVAAIRAGQCEPDTAGHREALEELAAHVRLARAYIDAPRRTPIIITHGLSGSGKSWLSERLAMMTDAVRVRSDVERKRIARSRRGTGIELYSPEMTRRTYDIRPAASSPVGIRPSSTPLFSRTGSASNFAPSLRSCRRRSCCSRSKRPRRSWRSESCAVCARSVASPTPTSRCCECSRAPRRHSRSASARTPSASTRAAMWTSSA